MNYSMKSENKLDGASNFRMWKTRIDLILAKNKVLDIVKPEFEEGKEKEPQNVAAMEKFKDVDINAMSIIVDSIKYHLIPYISHHLLVLSASQDVKFEFLVRSRVHQVKAGMTYSIKSENKLDGASNFKAWKTKIDLILAKNKVLDIMKPEFEEGEEKEP